MTNTFEDHTGETLTTESGHTMTIIAYRNAMDIDVKFENNIIVTHKTYKQFLDGRIRCKRVMAKQSTPLTDRVGMVNTNTDGMKMKIVAYRKATDIDVQFEDGKIVKHRQFASFQKGYIKHPNTK